MVGFDIYLLHLLKINPAANSYNYCIMLDRYTVRTITIPPKPPIIPALIRDTHISNLPNCSCLFIDNSSKLPDANKIVFSYSVERHAFIGKRTIANIKRRTCKISKTITMAAHVFFNIIFLLLRCNLNYLLEQPNVTSYC